MTGWLSWLASTAGVVVAGAAVCELLNIWRRSWLPTTAVGLSAFANPPLPLPIAGVGAAAATVLAGSEGAAVFGFDKSNKPNALLLVVMVVVAAGESKESEGAAVALV